MNGKQIDLEAPFNVNAQGSQEVFQQRIAPYRAELQLHCYRMLGSLSEAEDLVQETLVRAWRGMNRFEGRSSMRGWLYRIATNACLNFLAGRSRRVLPERLGLPNLPLPDGGPATEIAWLEPYPDSALEGIADTAPGPHARYEMREAVELAFVAAIQYLPSRQRAVLLLCDVMGWSAAETAELLATSVASVNSALQRARQTLLKRDLAVQSPVRAALDTRQSVLVERYMQALEHADLDGFIALLREDVTLSMPPWQQWYLGREAVRAFFAMAWSSPNYGGFRLVPTFANRQPACAMYSSTPGGSEFNAHSIHVLTPQDDSVAVLTVFLTPPLFPKFGLPLMLNTRN